MKQTTLVFDISNMLHRTFYAQTGEDDTTIAGLASHTALVTLNKYFRIVKPSRVVMAFDRKSWRKEYTASAACISKKPYKGNRRQGMTPKQEEKYKRFMGHMKEFEAMISNHTSIIALSANHLEADDMIGGYIEKFSPTENITLISTDTDFLQLLKFPDVQIISPATDKVQELVDYDQDANFYLFAKCIRGDPTDNVQSAYPGVRMTRIKKAYLDPFERANLMAETWSIGAEDDPDKITYVVGDLYKENQTLIDLTRQPEDIRELIDACVDMCVDKPRKFSMFFLMKFIGKYELHKIRDSIDTYLPLLSC